MPTRSFGGNTTTSQPIIHAETNVLGVLNVTSWEKWVSIAWLCSFVACIASRRGLRLFG